MRAAWRAPPPDGMGPSARRCRYHREGAVGSRWAPLVFKTSGAALGVARWVRLPCAPAKEDRWPTEPGSPRPPSVERVLAVVRDAARRVGRAEAVLRDAARDVVDDERARLAARRRATRRRRRSARAVEELLARPRARLARGPRPGHQRDRRDRPHEPRPRAVAGGGDRRRRARPRAATCSSSSTARPAGAGRASAPPRTHLIALTGAEDALVTNNNAAAVALAVGLAGRGGVAVSPRRAGRDRRRRADPGDRPASRRAADRGRDDEPDAGRRLRGAAGRRAGRGSSSASTRRTSPRAGSSRRPIRAEVAELAHAHGAIVVDDLGSGALLDTARVRARPRADAGASGSPPARTSSRSAATSWSAGRRPG